MILMLVQGSIDHKIPVTRNTEFIITKDTNPQFRLPGLENDLGIGNPNVFQICAPRESEVQTTGLRRAIRDPKQPILPRLTNAAGERSQPNASGTVAFCRRTPWRPVSRKAHRTFAVNAALL